MSMYVSDLNVEIILVDGERFIKTEAAIEEITREDYTEAYKEILRNKPQQVGIGDFQIRHCDACTEDFILHKKQVFCPVCKRMIELVEEDANFDFNEVFQEWQDDKNFIENILQGNKDAVLYIKDQESIDESRGWGDSAIIAEAGEPIIEDL